MPTVHTYFNPVPKMDVGTEHQLITLWQKSWRASEFLPVVLTHQMADAHPLRDAYVDVVSRFPSVNPPGYDLACWMRWLALAQAGGGLMTDYDVIARAFSPEFLALPSDVTVLDRGGVPCAVHTTPEGAQQIVLDVIARDHKHDGKHYSDMFFFQAQGYDKAPSLTAPYGAPDWQTAPAVHFSHHDCHLTSPGRPRVAVIRREMQLNLA